MRQPASQPGNYTLLGWTNIRFEFSDKSSSTFGELQVTFSVINELLESLILGFTAMVNL